MPENNNIADLGVNSIYIEDIEGEEGKTLTLEPDIKKQFVGLLKSRFESAERARDLDENRWIIAYHNYRGLYPKNVKFRETEKSRIFVKITKTKVLAAFGQLVDVIFGSGKFPIGISETKMPEGVPEHAYLDINNPVPGIETTPELAEEIEP